MDKKRQIQDGLRESVAGFRLLFVSNPYPMWVYDLETLQFLEVNDAAIEHYGYSRREFLNMGIDDIRPVEDVSRLLEDVSRERLPLQHSGVWRHTVKDGRIIDVEITSHTLEFEGRSAVLVVARDITQRKRTEERLIRRTQEMAELYETSLEINAQKDVSSLLSAIVRRAVSLLGTQRGGLFLMRPDGETIEMVAGYNQRAGAVGAALKLGEGLSGRVAQTGQPLMIADYDSWEGRAPYSTVGPIGRIVAVPLQHQGEVVGVINVFDDERTGGFDEEEIQLLNLFAAQATVAIQNARLYQEQQQYNIALEQQVARRTSELMEANQRLQELDRIKSRIVDNISHELRTPASILNLYLDLLQQGPVEKRSKYLAVMKKQMAQLVMLIEDNLKLAQLDLMREQVTFAAVDLNEVVDEILESQRQRAEAFGLGLTFAPRAEAASTWGDRRQLAEVIRHLLANAINYTHEGKIQVSTFLVPEQEFVCLQVEDNGIGIAVQDMPHLFDSFYRGQASVGSQKPGLGLGLTIAREIVELHRGKIEVESQLDKGTIFRVLLPLATKTR